jgi:hypothetical protein
MQRIGDVLYASSGNSGPTGAEHGAIAAEKQCMGTANLGWHRISTSASVTR